MTCCMRTTFSLSLMDKFDKEESGEWTTSELENKLPHYIKEIIVRDVLISWEHNDVIYLCDAAPYKSPSILITYIDREEFFRSNVIAGHMEKLDFFTIYPDLWKRNLNFHFEKKAEAFFSPVTGELTKFKIKIKGSQWITIYDLGKRIKI